MRKLKRNVDDSLSQVLLVLVVRLDDEDGDDGGDDEDDGCDVNDDDLLNDEDVAVVDVVVGVNGVDDENYDVDCDEVVAMELMRNCCCCYLSYYCYYYYC